MANGKKRLPKLSQAPEKRSSRYFAAYRDHGGVPQKQRFTRDRGESEVLYAQWIAAHYGPDGHLLAQPIQLLMDAVDQDGNQTDHASIVTSMPHIVDAYLQFQRARIRPDGVARQRGTIGAEQYVEIEYITKLVFSWLTERFADRIRTTPFDRLIQPNDYKLMMLAFSHRFSRGVINKCRIRFWDIVKFAFEHPFQQRLPFTKDNVPRYGGTTEPQPRDIPSKETLQTIMRWATDLERLWIWMGIGLGFGQSDLADCRPSYFNAESYDARRTKTGKERYGQMPPFIWTLMESYLAMNPRNNDDFMFATKNGLALVRQDMKTDEEILHGTRTRPPSKRLVKKTDVVAQHWYRLLRSSGVKWKQGFYVLRHIGATAFTKRPGVGLIEIRSFLGHATSQMSDHYMKPLKPEYRPVIEWINSVLDSDEPMAWEDKPAELAKVRALIEKRRTQKGKRKKRRT